MQKQSGQYVGLAETCARIAETAPAVGALLARYFPATGGCLYPDAAGHVCVGESEGAASDRPASVYARCVSKLSPLVSAFAAAAMDNAAMACINIAKERSMFACALDLARHPLDPMQRQLFVARMMPLPAPVHRQDDAVASCIWLRLWTIHAWVLELRLVLALTGGPVGEQQAMLEGLDGDLTSLLKPDAFWLSVDLGAVSPAEIVARAPVEAVAVGNLAWPERLGALLPDVALSLRNLRQRGLTVAQDSEAGWLSYRGHLVEAPLAESRHLPARRRDSFGMHSQR